MPSTFLTFKERERLTSFPDEMPQWDLITYFTLTEYDCSLIDAYQSATNRLGQLYNSVPCATSDFVPPSSIPRQATSSPS